MKHFRRSEKREQDSTMGKKTQSDVDWYFSSYETLIDADKVGSKTRPPFVVLIFSLW